MAKRILVVDDEPFILKVFQRFFNAMGIHAHVAESWDEGEKVYGSLNIDLVILDIVMPDVSGFEVAKKIKEQNPAQKVVLITGLGSEITEDNACEHGVDVDDYLFKPFTYNGVKTMLDSVLLSEASISA